MEGKTDLRVLRTKKSIYEAFLSLLQEKDLDKITVQDISERAFINRNTFYLHYRDKEDLLRAVSAERLQNLRQIITRSTGEMDEAHFCPLILDILREIAQNRPFYRAMMRDNSNTYFTEQLKAEITAQMLAAIHEDAPDYQTLFCIEYVVTGFIGIIRFSLGREEEFAVNEIANLVFQLIFDNVLELLRENGSVAFEDRFPQ